MIPKKIHYCWFGGRRMPRSISKYIASWKKYCPDYEIVYWNEKNFDVACCEFVRSAYNANAWAFVSDYARLKIVHDEGGIYLDTDVELVRSLDELLLGSDAYFGLDQNGAINTGLGFGASKGNKFIKELMKTYEKMDYDDSRKCDIACPIINTLDAKRLLKFDGKKVKNMDFFGYEGENIAMYAARYFDPLSPGSTKDLMSDVTFSIHHYDASWKDGHIRMKRRLANYIGQEKINYMKCKMKR